VVGNLGDILDAGDVGSVLEIGDLASVPEVGDVGSTLEVGDLASVLEAGDLASDLEVDDVVEVGDASDLEVGDLANDREVDDIGEVGDDVPTTRRRDVTGGGPIKPKVGLEDADEVEEYLVLLGWPLSPCAGPGVGLVIETLRPCVTLVLLVPESETLDDSRGLAGVVMKTRESRD